MSHLLPVQDPAWAVSLGLAVRGLDLVPPCVDGLQGEEGPRLARHGKGRLERGGLKAEMSQGVMDTTTWIYKIRP